MRDLHTTTEESVERRLELVEDPPAQARVTIDHELRTVRRDQALSEMAVMMIDTVKVIKPVIDLLSARGLVWAAFGGLVGLSTYALLHPSWERLAVVGAYAILAPYLIRTGWKA